MTTSIGRRGLLIGGAAVLTGACLVTPAAATAKVVDVVVAEGSLSVPSSLPEGVVTFRVRSTGPALSVIFMRLRPGSSIETYLSDLAKTNSKDLEVRKAAAKAIEQSADGLGGAVVTAQIPVTFTQVLPPGRYHLIAFDYQNPNVPPVVRELGVKGTSAGPYPAGEATIAMWQAGTRTRFAVTGPRLPARGRYLVVNGSDGLNEAVLVPVKPGTTERDVQAAFDAFREGKPPPSMPFAGQPTGLAPLSPGHVAVLETSLSAGPYVLWTYMPDPRTGLPRAWDGAFTLITLT
ncbi:hypothetical protein [Nonomuraea sediminis]|uniref:hypothetical protein n=1 Tax=Nonomuraea sediminis TaxID=2835864 RepID=UPI001BDBF7FB|nr:hypothetical protein [Nonomuraea sediminis]